jgi:hypothetical protein
MSRLLAVVAVVALVCGACGQLPTAPTSSPAGSQFHERIVDRVPMPAASLADSGETVSGQPQPDGTFTYGLTALNVGTGCAGSISGVTEFRDGRQNVIAVLPWALPASTVVRPSERFGYQVLLTQGGAFSPATTIRPYALRASGTFWTTFSYQTVACS